MGARGDVLPVRKLSVLVHVDPPQGRARAAGHAVVFPAEEGDAMRAWLIVHLLAAGLWLGCVLVEIAFERTLAAQGKWHLLARLHDRVDRWVELPALAVVVMTGLWMLHSQFGDVVLSSWLRAKIAFGALAVLANLYCAGVSAPPLGRSR